MWERQQAGLKVKSQAVITDPTITCAGQFVKTGSGTSRSTIGSSQQIFCLADFIGGGGGSSSGSSHCSEANPDAGFGYGVG